jgi:transcriptional regulator with XRE-family HTH domain
MCRAHYYAHVSTTELGYQELRSRIRAAIREARDAAGMSQQQLADRIKLSRFTVMRLESGRQDLRLDQAEAIEASTKATGLAELVKLRDRVAETRRGAPARDQTVRDLLERRGIHRVEATLVDDLDLAGCLEANPAVLAAEWSIVIPTRRRETELLGPRAMMAGHYEHQLQRLSDLIGKRSDPEAAGICESPRVLQPAIVVRTASGDECAVWPVLPREGDLRGANAPVISSDDPTVVDEVAGHIDYALRAAEPVHKNDTLAILDDEPRDGTRTLRFVGYAPHSERDGEQERPRVGFAASFVVLHGVAPREGYPPRRRLIVYFRDDEPSNPDVWSLVSTRVDSADVHQALGDDDGAGEWRSPFSAEDAAVRDARELENDEFAIPERAFRLAALRELETKFGLLENEGDPVALEKHLARFEDLEVPARLQTVDKSAESPRRRPILPRVFAYDLDGGDGESRLKRLRESGVRFQPIGYEDLADHPGLNDFLVAAGRDGWLQKKLEDLKVAPR